MLLDALDWIIIAVFFAAVLLISLAVARRSGKSASEFFLSGRNMPWWLLGFSMVATTFSTDTPNLVTDIVRQHGVAGNWAWWAFLLTGMLTVFVYAKLWRRSGVMTDIEFYELRYSGKSAAFLRGFRAIYLGIFFNIMIMAAVTLAAIKIGGVMLDLTPVQTVVIAAVVTGTYSALGGLKGVILTDFFLFLAAMAGSVLAALAALNHQAVGGLQNLLDHPAVAPRLSLLPDFSDREAFVTILVIPLAVQWWSVWYPGSEPGGGGYIAQRMLAARNERHAVGATLFFNAAHYALRPWPWIIVALCSLVVFPDLESLKAAFPRLSPSVVKHDLAYPAMLTFLPHGLLGFVLASLIAAYMSTISTHLNWGSSYVVHDFYKRFIDPGASEANLVRLGRLSTLAMMAAAGAAALWLENAFSAFQILLQIGAGTGILFILRWFWWRINAFSELAAMAVSFAVALYFEFLHPYAAWLLDGRPDVDSVRLIYGAGGTMKLLIGVGITTAAWLAVTLLTPPADEERLRSFLRIARPGGPGWKRVRDRAAQEGIALEDEGEGWNVPQGILCMIAGCFAVYGALFAAGYGLYGNLGPALALAGISLVSAVFVALRWKKAAGR